MKNYTVFHSVTAFPGVAWRLNPRLLDAFGALLDGSGVVTLWR
jgi:hypothetical protein